MADTILDREPRDVDVVIVLSNLNVRVGEDTVTIACTVCRRDRINDADVGSRALGEAGR